MAFIPIPSDLWRFSLFCLEFDLCLQMDPLRGELAKITAENNKLHTDIIALQTTSADREKRAQQISKQQEADYAELKFVNSQLLHALDSQKQKHEQDRRRMEDALQRHGIVTEKSSGRGQQPNVPRILEKLQKIDIETVRVVLWKY